MFSSLLAPSLWPAAAWTIFYSHEMTPNQIRLTQQLFVYHRSGFKFIQVAEVHNCIMLVKGRIVESAFRQSSNQRHLPAFETQSNAPTRTRLLPLVTLAAGLSMP